MYIKLQSVLEEERNAVIARDYKSLYDILSSKETILSDISEISAGRSALVASMLDNKGASGRKGLNALIGRSEGEEKSTLTVSVENLSESMESVAAKIKSNSLLIGASLVNLGRSLDFLEAFFIRGTYQSTGLVGGAALKGMRLRKGV